MNVYGLLPDHAVNALPPPVPLVGENPDDVTEFPVLPAFTLLPLFRSVIVPVGKGSILKTCADVKFDPLHTKFAVCAVSAALPELIQRAVKLLEPDLVGEPVKLSRVPDTDVNALATVHEFAALVSAIVKTCDVPV